MNLDAQVTYDPGDGLFTLVSPYTHEGIVIPMLLELPEGFRFAASVPRLLWSLVSALDLSLEAALVHDYLYDFGEPLGVTRSQADLEFWEVMVARSVTPWKAHAAYWSVRAFGWRLWCAGDNIVV